MNHYRFAATALLAIVSASVRAADLYVYAKGGRVETVPRALPSVGVRLDGKGTVLGLHGADDATKAACGWYRVVPSAQSVSSNQYVAARSYVVRMVTAEEVLAVSNRVARAVPTPEQRIAQAYAELPAGMATDKRIAAILAAVARVVTNQTAEAVTVTIPAAKEVAR